MPAENEVELKPIMSGKHTLRYHGQGYELWAECSCRDTDENGWLWIEPYLLVQGKSRREAIKAEFAKHATA